jgi:hypothetical protein
MITQEEYDALVAQNAVLLDALRSATESVRSDYKQGYVSWDVYNKIIVASEMRPHECLYKLKENTVRQFADFALNQIRDKK